MQAGWGLVSDRLGRVRTMRLSLALAGLGACASALAPTLGALVVLRAVTGAAFAAVVPGSLIYVGDTVDVRERHGPVTELMRAMALGMALAAVVAGALADAVGWRVTLALPGMLALIAAAATRLPEPATAGRREGFATVVRSRWAVLVLAFAFVEGAVILGVLPLLPSVLQVSGTSALGSGLVTAAYGASLIVLARAVKTLSVRVRPPSLMAVGAGLGVVAYAVLAISAGPVAVLVASALLAGTWSFLHSSVQVWATEVVAHARGAMISLFATSLFLGSAAGTAIGSEFIVGSTAPYFAGSGVVLAALGTALVLARRRHTG
jgi:predicted MFS family arabinose efflux permease